LRTLIINDSFSKRRLTAVFLITGTGVRVDDFNYLSAPHGGNGTHLSAAHVQGIATKTAGANFSGWVAPGSSTQIPEPSLLLLLGAGLVGIGSAAWRKVK
jgi:hypothetical protein